MSKKTAIFCIKVLSFSEVGPIFCIGTVVDQGGMLMGTKKRMLRMMITALVLCAFFALGIKNAGGAEAATTMGYRFDFNAADVESGSEIELRTLNAFLAVEPKDSAVSSLAGRLP